MAKIALITDTHMGARNNCSIFNKFFLRFFDEIFFPYLENNNIETIIHLGDLGEYRKQVNLNILNSWNENVFDRLKKYTCFFISGNHDIFFRNENTVSIQKSLLLDKKFGFHLINSFPETIEIDSKKLDLIPWITSSNENEIQRFLSSSFSSILFSHLEISGALMTPGLYCQESQLDISFLEKYHSIFSGHFHLRSQVKNVCYIGNPYEIIWSDCGYKKGFAILDTETLRIEYINNPITIFEKIKFDEIKTSEKEFDLESLKSKHIKIYITESSDKSKLNSFVSLIEKVNPYSLIIQEQNLNQEQLLIDSISFKEIESKDTFYYIEKYIHTLFDNQKLKLDKDKLISIIHSIYQESQTLEI